MTKTPRALNDIALAAGIAPQSIRWPNDALHWEKLKHAVDDIRALVAAVDAECLAVENNGDFSTEGMKRRRTEIGRKAVEQLDDFAAVRAAEAAVTKALATFESNMTDIPPKPETAHDIAMATETRAYIRSQNSPDTWVMNHLDESMIVAATIYAPAYLSGLKPETVALIRDRARTALHPDFVKRGQEASAALATLKEGVEAAKRMILERTSTRQDRDGQVRGTDEPISAAMPVQAAE